MLKSLYPNCFQRFSWLMFALAIIFIVVMLIMLLSLSFFFASFTSTSFIALVLTIICYLIGNSLTDVKALVESPQSAGIDPSPIVVKVVQVAFYLFPNLSFFDIKTQAAHGLAMSPAHVCWILTYGIVYTAIVMAGSCAIFCRREFP